MGRPTRKPNGRPTGKRPESRHDNREIVVVSQEHRDSSLKINSGSIIEGFEGDLSDEYLQKNSSYYRMLTSFIKHQMIDGIDYGILEKTEKYTLLKSGGEKLCKLLGLSVQFELMNHVTDFNIPFFHYHYRCNLLTRINGESILVGQGEGNANLREKRYEKLQYRAYDLNNTICKMAQKRAFIAAVLIASGSSLFFTQDLEN